MDKNKDENKPEFAPVVSVLGHVDHGKTSLLDKIRETSVAARERGGITQKIGASEIEIKHEGKIRKVTFIDTPGHEAFANMRSQGVSAADIVLLIVAADDGVMPQTRESILKIIDAKIPFIVVFTKIDLETAVLERAKQSVIKEGVMLEGLGGEVPYIGISSKTGENVKELLDLIVLVYDMAGVKKDQAAPFMGVVIDAKQDKRRGVLVSLVVKQGKIKIGDRIYTHGRDAGKIRAIISASSKNVQTALPGDAVEILGVLEVMPAGAVLFDREMEPMVAPKAAITGPQASDIMAYLRGEEVEMVPVILKTETSAELEAIKNSMPKNIKLIFEGQGEIGIADVLMAKDFHALVLGFNVAITTEAKQLADAEKVYYKSYSIIYEMLDELVQLIGALGQEETERVLGEGKILASFLGTTGPILGIRVEKGRLAAGDRIRIFRGEKELGLSEITSIKHGKEDAKVAEKGTECGIMISPQVDFAPQDAIIAYKKG